MSSDIVIGDVEAPPEFVGFPSISRLSRRCVITEKIDGTNATVYVSDSGAVFAGSRTRWITPSDDNHGFAAWVRDHEDELRLLGPGRHCGEWWGSGVQRGYGLKKGEKRFSMFNTVRWCLHGTEPKRIETADPRIEKYQDVLPPCCGLVPILYDGIFDTAAVDACIERLRLEGSVASPGFMKPEGVVVFHTAANVAFKKTLVKDEMPKSLVQHNVNKG